MNEYKKGAAYMLGEVENNNANCEKMIDARGTDVYFDKTRYSKLNEQASSPQFKLSEFYRDNGIDTILNTYGSGYPDQRIEFAKQNSPLYMWAAPTLAGKEKITKKNTPNEIFSKIDRMILLLKGNVEESASSQFVKGLIQSFF